MKFPKYADYETTLDGLKSWLTDAIKAADSETDWGILPEHRAHGHGALAMGNALLGFLRCIERSKVTMTPEQVVALYNLCRGYCVEFNPDNYSAQSDLPEGYVAGWVGNIFVGCSPEGEISS